MTPREALVYAYEESQYVAYQARKPEPETDDPTKSTVIGNYRTIAALRKSLQAQDLIGRILTDEEVATEVPQVWQYPNGLGARALKENERLDWAA